MADERKEEVGLSDAEWQALLKELNVDISKATQEALVRPITQAEIDYLLRQYAFLDICDASATEPLADHPAKITIAKSGWEIHNHANRLIVSPGRWLFGPYKDDEDQSGGGKGLAGAGTIIKQIVDSADSMIEMASKQWPAARVRGGYVLMKFAAWMSAQQRGYSLEGFTPTEKQQEVFKHLLTAKGIALSSVEPEVHERPR